MGYRADAVRDRPRAWHAGAAVPAGGSGVRRRRRLVHGGRRERDHGVRGARPAAAAGQARQRDGRRAGAPRRDGRAQRVARGDRGVAVGRSRDRRARCGGSLGAARARPARSSCAGGAPGAARVDRGGAVRCRRQAAGADGPVAGRAARDRGARRGDRRDRAVAPRAAAGAGHAAARVDREADGVRRPDAAGERLLTRRRGGPAADAGAGPRRAERQREDRVESGDRIAWSAAIGFWAAMGFAVVAPNIRGSTGFGIDYEQADDREHRADAVRDVESVNRWARAQPWCDGDRLVIGGISYGGYMTLLALTRQPTLWRAGIDGSGMSNLVTMEQLEDQTIRAFDDTEFGVLGKDDALLVEWSPITQVDRIVAPVFVYQGVRDPVTPQHEADQIVAALRRRGVPVEYMLLANEGHGVTRRENIIAEHMDLQRP
ncbi:MAG: S9 family peptidase [Deltaproteobacteria bacterium]|nr:MAG: S9 family peptidase [Deltaproteobacteria bacterium]